MWICKHMSVPKFAFSKHVHIHGQQSVSSTYLQQYMSIIGKTEFNKDNHVHTLSPDYLLIHLYLYLLSRKPKITNDYLYKKKFITPRLEVLVKIH